MKQKVDECYDNSVEIRQLIIGEMERGSELGNPTSNDTEDLEETQVGESCKDDELIDSRTRG